MKTEHAALTLITAALLASAPLHAEDFRARASAQVIATTETLVDDVKAEVSFGKDVAARILGRYKLDEDAELTRYVNLVGQAVVTHADRPELQFHFAVLDTDSVNAYAAPGGYVFITRGALRNMKNEAELAAVLAHEVAHVSRKHIVKELRIRAMEKAPEAGISRLLGGASDPTRVAFAQTVDKAVHMLFESGLKREDELEADRVGTLFLANTGYDATALRSYVARLKSQQGEPMKMMYATHPPFEKRLALLDELIASEMLAVENAPRAEQRFTSRIH